MNIEDARRDFLHMLESRANLPVGSPVLEAFAATPREDFMPPPPWFVSTGPHSVGPTDDATHLYADVVVALRREHAINNGQPSLHAACLRVLNLQSSETVLHIGAGTGFYTAILARLVGPAGRVHAFELDPDLACAAAANLRSNPQVTVYSASGASPGLPLADAIYVNAGASAPLPLWLDALHVGGRLLFPLTRDDGSGAMLLVTRPLSPESTTWPARFLMEVAFIPCTGARDPESASALAVSFLRGDLDRVRWLHRDDSPGTTAWCTGPGWWLSTNSADDPQPATAAAPSTPP